MNPDVQLLAALEGERNPDLAELEAEANRPGGAPGYTPIPIDHLAEHRIAQLVEAINPAQEQEGNR